MVSRDERELRFEQIYVPLFPVIYRVAYGIVGDASLAEELCQEAFIRLMERPRQLPDLTQSRYWLIRVVRNLSLNVEKRKAREARAYERAGRLEPRHEGGADEQVLREETRSLVQRALAGLPHGLRTALVLREYADLNYREIGSIMSISEANVKVRVFRARERLAREIERLESAAPHDDSTEGASDVP